MNSNDKRQFETYLKQNSDIMFIDEIHGIKILSIESCVVPNPFFNFNARAFEYGIALIKRKFEKKTDLLLSPNSKPSDWLYYRLYENGLTRFVNKEVHS